MGSKTMLVAYSHWTVVFQCFTGLQLSSDVREMCSSQTQPDMMLLGVLSAFKCGLVLSVLSTTILKAGLAHCQPGQGLRQLLCQLVMLWAVTGMSRGRQLNVGGSSREEKLMLEKSVKLLLWGGCRRKTWAKSGTKAMGQTVIWWHSFILGFLLGPWKSIFLPSESLCSWLQKMLRDLSLETEALPVNCPQNCCGAMLPSLSPLLPQHRQQQLESRR